ncbi:MAG: hypothetical protein Q9166_006309 [cf. Caloplaca sp. 2 TL-2023]
MSTNTQYADIVNRLSTNCTFPAADEFDNHTCCICQENSLVRDGAEVPIKLGCGHVLGMSCILTWTFNQIDEGNISPECPQCRTPFLTYEARSDRAASGYSRTRFPTNRYLRPLSTLGGIDEDIALHLPLPRRRFNDFDIDRPVPGGWHGRDEISRPYQSRWISEENDEENEEDNEDYTGSPIRRRGHWAEEHIDTPNRRRTRLSDEDIYMPTRRRNCFTGTGRYLNTTLRRRSYLTESDEDLDTPVRRRTYLTESDEDVDIPIQRRTRLTDEYTEIPIRSRVH